MREVFSSPETATVGLYKSVLDEAGILNFVRNERAFQGEVQAMAFFPTICITDDDRYEEAIALLKTVQDAMPANGPEWICAECKESVPGTFDSCWNCQALRPEATAAH